MRRPDWMALPLMLLLLSGQSAAQELQPGITPPRLPGAGATAGGEAPEAEPALENELNPEGYKAHRSKSPHQLWVELQAIDRELRYEAEELNYDALPDLSRGFASRMWALLSITYHDLPLTNQVLAKRTTAIGSAMTNRWTSAAASHWPDRLASPLRFTETLMEALERAYPPEVLNPVAAGVEAEPTAGEEPEATAEVAAQKGASGDD